MFPEKLGPVCIVPKFWRKNVFNQHDRNEAKKIEWKPLTNKYRANYNYDAWKFGTGQKLDIIGVTEFDSSTDYISGQDTTKLLALLKS